MLAFEGAVYVNTGLRRYCDRCDRRLLRHSGMTELDDFVQHSLDGTNRQ